MDIEIIPVAIQAIHEMISLKEEIERRKKDSEEKDNLIRHLESELLKPNIPPELIENLKNQAETIEILQRKIKDLEYVYEI